MYSSNDSISNQMQNRDNCNFRITEAFSVIEFNGRLCDSVIRTYLEDPQGARQVWLKTLLPMAKKLHNATYSAFPCLLSSGNANQPQEPIVLEVAEKALDALMFVAGFNGRADMGLEVAKTARSRRFTKEILVKLAKSYSRGKIEKIVMLDSDSFLKDGESASTNGKSKSRTLTVGAQSSGNWVENGLERSIESELGVLLETNPNRKFPIKNIRFKFSK